MFRLYLYLRGRLYNHSLLGRKYKLLYWTFIGHLSDISDILCLYCWRLFGEVGEYLDLYFESIATPVLRLLDRLYALDSRRGVKWVRSY